MKKNSGPKSKKVIAKKQSTSRSQKQKTKTTPLQPVSLPTQFLPPPIITAPINPPLPRHPYPRHLTQWVDTIENESLYPKQPLTTHEDVFSPTEWDGMNLDPLPLNPSRIHYTVGGKKNLYKNRKAKKTRKKKSYKKNKKYNYKKKKSTIKKN
tara:strand:+ start:393 stop:851 length:459 start_codon:yes stop_codon:yes gene_type:complete